MKKIKMFEDFLNEGWKNLAVGSAIAASSFLNPNTTLSSRPNIEQSIKSDTKLYQYVINAMNDNQIQAARDLVSTTDEKNELYNFIRNNKIQAARNYIKYELKK